MKSASHESAAAGNAGTPQPTRLIAYLEATDAGDQPSVKQSGWHETDSLDGTPIVNENTRRLSNKECKEHNIDHKVPPEDLAAGNAGTPQPDPSDADVKDAAKALHQESQAPADPVCAAAARRGEKKFATHKVTLLDGTEEYRHISEIGPKSTYASAMRIDV